MSRKLNIVVAACDNMGIGIDGKIPWRLKKDMAFFKKITKTTQEEKKRNAVIMGRRTWESIPPKFRPLEGRLNIVLSTKLTEAPEGALLFPNFSNALGAMDENVENVFIIGGASVYQEAMISDMPCKIFFTRVEGNFECDTFFPKFDTEIFKKVEDSDEVPSGKLEENGVNFSIEVYEKTFS